MLVLNALEQFVSPVIQLTFVNKEIVLLLNYLMLLEMPVSIVLSLIVLIVMKTVNVLDVLMDLFLLAMDQLVLFAQLVAKLVMLVETVNNVRTQNKR